MAGQYKGKILIHEEIALEHMYLVIETPEIAKEAEIGQFVQVRCSDSIVPLLRRPISLHEINKEKGTISFLYQVKGIGTKSLASLRENSEIDLVGPLGNGFKLPENKNKKVLVVGGGIGIAPLLPPLKELKDNKYEVTTILGFNSKEQMLRIKNYENYSDKLFITTMDGSHSLKGLVTLPLQEELEKENYEIIYTCGPELMLKAVADLANQYNIPCQVSLESYMACGIGACLGCICKTKIKDEEVYSRVCVEGPVFDSKEVVWLGK